MKYYVLTSQNRLMLYKDSNGEIVEGYHYIIWANESNKHIYQLSEEEIKEFDEVNNTNYWSFAKSVESLENMN